jgi:hypothetical protein
MTHIIGAGRLLFFKVVSKIYSRHENVKAFGNKAIIQPYVFF